MYNLVIIEHQGTDHLHSINDIILLGTDSHKGHTLCILQTRVWHVTWACWLRVKMYTLGEERWIMIDVMDGSRKWNPSSAASDGRVKLHQPPSCPWKALHWRPGRNPDQPLYLWANLRAKRPPVPNTVPLQQDNHSAHWAVSHTSKPLGSVQNVFVSSDHTSVSFKLDGHFRSAFFQFSLMTSFFSCCC